MKGNGLAYPRQLPSELRRLVEQYGIPVPVELLRDWIGAIPEGPEKDEIRQYLSRHPWLEALLLRRPGPPPTPESRRSQLLFLLALALMTTALGVLLWLSW
jgi:hypothetical protein